MIKPCEHFACYFIVQKLFLKHDVFAGEGFSGDAAVQLALWRSVFPQGGTMQPIEAGEAQQLANSSLVSWVMGLRMGGGNAVFSEAAEEVQNSSITCTVFLLEQSFADICSDTGAMDVAHLPHKGHCCASVICQRKFCTVPATAAAVPWLNTSFLFWSS